MISIILLLSKSHVFWDANKAAFQQTLAKLWVGGVTQITHLKTKYLSFYKSEWSKSSSLTQ